MINLPIAAFRRAHQIIWSEGCWKYLLAPIVLTALLAPTLIGLCYLLAWKFGPQVAMYFLGDHGMGTFVRTLFILLIFIPGLAPCYVAFRGLVMVCYAPFLDHLSNRAEKVITGSADEVSRSLLESIKRPLCMALLTIGASMAVLAGGLALGLIPLIGFLLTFGFVIPLELFLSSISYLDPYFERRGFTPQSSFRFLRRHFLSVCVFGLLGLVIMAVPVVGWFLGPTYSVVAGIVYAILLFESDSPAEP